MNKALCRCCQSSEFLALFLMTSVFAIFKVDFIILSPLAFFASYTRNKSCLKEQWGYCSLVIIQIQNSYACYGSMEVFFYEKHTSKNSKRLISVQFHLPTSKLRFWALPLWKWTCPNYLYCQQLDLFNFTMAILKLGSHNKRIVLIHCHK